jgi:hypothetical protein
MATIAVFGVLGGGAYAASKIGTGEIARHAVTSPKLATASVTAGKLGERAINSSKLAAGAVRTNAIAAKADGVALGGVRVRVDGSYLDWFNRLGGAPAIEHPSPGRYVLSWPGWPSPAAAGIVRSATLAEGEGGEVQAFRESNATTGTVEIVLTRDRSGTLADHAFDYIAFGTSRRVTP